MQDMDHAIWWQFRRFLRVMGLCISMYGNFKWVVSPHNPSIALVHFLVKHIRLKDTNL